MPVFNVLCIIHFVNDQSIIITMLLVKTKIGLSKLSGIGLFANQFISKGTVIWKFNPDLDLVIDDIQLANLPDIAKEQILHYDYFNLKTGKHVLCFDDARFFNHSENPNIIGVDSPYDDEGINTATRDIHKGEELTVNYKTYDANFDYKMSAPGV